MKHALAAALALAAGCGEDAAPLGSAPLRLIQVAPEQLDFGSVAIFDGSSRDLIVTNDGSLTLTLDVITIEGTDRESFSARPDETIKVGAGRSKSISVSFAPVARGAHSAELVIIHDGTRTDPVRVPLSGLATGCVDVDTDGFGDGCTPGPDCDDSNAGIHPGATETCDGVDNDCDMEKDEGLPLTTYYRDADGDTYGAAETRMACTATTGFSEKTGDCDDTNPMRSPGTAEICTGGVDEDCDSKIDVQDEDCVVPVMNCDEQDDCGLNSNGLTCPRIGAQPEVCAKACRKKADCPSASSCRPLPGSASLGFCQTATGSTSEGGACMTSSECSDGLCVQGACRKLCQRQSDCSAVDICGVALYNTREIGGRDARRLTTVCRPVGTRQPIGGTCNLSATNVDTGLCATEHCDLPPWSATQAGALCESVCASSTDCRGGQTCGLVYNGMAETMPLPPTAESAGRYYEAVFGCFTPYFRLNPATWQRFPPGQGSLGSACDPDAPEGKLVCRSHLCAQFAPIRGQCTDTCQTNTDCRTPSTPNWVCRYGDLSLTGIFLQDYDIADIAKFVLIGVCAP